jgi:hypothetical protein
VAAFLLLSALPAAAQLQVKPLAKAPPEIPLAEWAAQGPVEQIRWKVRISKPELSIIQRQFVNIETSVSGKELHRQSGERELWFFAAVRAANGAWLPSRDTAGVRLEAPPPKSGDLVCETQLLVLPGEYTLVVALYDPGSEKRSVALRKLTIPAIRGDPLPELARNFPTVEFLQGGGRTNPPPRSAAPAGRRRFPRTFEMRAYPSIRPDVVGSSSEPVVHRPSRLWLPLETRRPLDLDIIVNFSTSEPYAGRGDFHRKNLATMLGMMLVLSQISLPNGRICLTAVDVAGRSVLFEQENAGTLDWTRLRNKLAELNPYTVRARDLQERRKNAAFFREFLARKLAEPPAALHGAQGNSTAAAEPQRVVIVVTSLLELARGSDLAPLAPPARKTHFYYLRYQISLGNVFDDFGRIFAHLEPHRFHLDSPLAFRRALARMLADLRTL